MSEELNNDSNLDPALSLNTGENIIKALENLKNVGYKNNQVFIPLLEDEIDDLFRSDRLLRKIICKYPNSAKSLGYQLSNSSGVITEENDSLVLKGFNDASIMARKYGKAFLVFSDANTDNIQLTKSSKLDSYRVLFNLKVEGNFYIYKSEERIHKTKVFVFLGDRTYLKEATIEKDNYSDSILQGIKRAFDLFFNSNEIGYYIISNLSYLIMGIDGLKNKALNEEGRASITERLNSININRDLTRIIIHDAVGEKVSFISQSMTGVTEMIHVIADFLVTYTDYPTDQLFESNPKQNMGSGIANQLIARMLWAKRLQTWVEENWLDNYIKLFRIIKSEDVKVKIPFKVEMNLAERAEIEDKAASRLQKLINSGIINVKEARTGYEGDEFTLNIVLDKSFDLEAASKPEVKETSTPESEQTEQNTEENTDSEIDNSFWDNLANLTESEILEVANSVLT